MDILHTLFYFLVAVGLLVAFHEFGHFWMARRLGIKVLRFSIGFGQILWRFRSKTQETEYVVSAIPLGGYVKMVDEREGPVAPADLPYAFNRQPVLTRTLVVVAGPLSNLLLAVLLYWGIFMHGETGLRPLVGPAEPGTLAAAAGFEAGEEIRAVNDVATPTWNEALNRIVASVINGENSITVTVTGADETPIDRMLQVPENLRAPDKFFERLGLTPWLPDLDPVVGHVLSDGVAFRAGLRDGDRLLSADGQAITHWRNWVDYVREHPGQTIALTLEREGTPLTLELTPASVPGPNGAAIGKIGAAVKVPPEIWADLQIHYSLGPWAAFKAAGLRTYELSWASLKMMAAMLIGYASVDNLSGPIGIAQYAGESAKGGAIEFLKFLAVVSISLGVLNLLPIPVLDGGHLLFYAIEAIKGRPLSDRAQLLFQQIGIAFLVSLMSLAFFLDIERLLD